MEEKKPASAPATPVKKLTLETESLKPEVSITKFSYRHGIVETEGKPNENK